MPKTSMLEDSRFPGTHRGDGAEDMKERVGYTSPPTHISLFSGIGGFDLGFARAGFTTLVAIDSDQDACDTYRLNLVTGYEDHLTQDEPPVSMERDKKTVSTWEILEAPGVGGITVVSGGPLCQGFSHIGPRDPDDERNELYLEMVRIVHQAKPVCFVMENVPGLATMHDGQTIMEVCETFSAGGYTVAWDIVDAADYGVPQPRERVIILGERIDVMAMPDEGNPQLHLGATPGQVEHPESFRDRHDLPEPDQATLGAVAAAIAALDANQVAAHQDGAVPVARAAKVAAERALPFLVHARCVVDASGDERTHKDMLGLCPPTLKGQHGGSLPREAGVDPVQTVATRGAVQVLEPEARVLPQDQY